MKLPACLLAACAGLALVSVSRAAVLRVPVTAAKRIPLHAAVGAAVGAAPLPPLASADNPSLALTRIAGRYGIDADAQRPADLGEGDYAEVRRGRFAERAVAVKIPYLDPGGMVRHEAAVARRLQEAGGEELFVEAAADEELGVLVMEELAGFKTLEEWMDGRARLGPRSLKRIARQLLAGLEVLAAAGLVHSDLRPSNVMIGPGLRLKIVDFGISADAGGYVPYPNYEGWRGGHYRYVSENQLRNGPARYGDDRHAVGVMLGELARRTPGAVGVYAHGSERR